MVGYAVKVTLNMLQLNVQNSYEYPVKALCLNEVFNLPNGLDCASIHTLIMDFYSEGTLSQLSVSFFGKFSNLKSLRLNGSTFNDDMISMVSKLSLLGFISLHGCTMANDYLSKLFKGCTNLEEIHLLQCKYSSEIFINLPPQMKIFEVEHYILFEIDASLCTQLKCL